jgi:hypothetical protein
VAGLLCGSDVSGGVLRDWVICGSDVSGGVLSDWVIVRERCEWGSVKWLGYFSEI